MPYNGVASISCTIVKSFGLEAGGGVFLVNSYPEVWLNVVP